MAQELVLAELSAIRNPFHMSEKSAFRTCGHDLPELFKNTLWAL